MTERMFLDQPTLARTEAVVQAADASGIVLDRTVFYARSGGQPGDAGTLHWDGGATPIGEAIKGEGENILHVPGEGASLPPVGATVTAALDWPRRHRLMRMHTTLHLLCAALPGVSVTGGQIGADKSRLDFDMAEPPPREALEAQVQALIDGAHPVSAHWVDADILETNPGLVRTLSVKPPTGSGRLRLVRIGTEEKPIDLQPCGGTHVGNTREIGTVRIVKIENKGRQNRRVSLELVAQDVAGQGTP